MNGFFWKIKEGRITLVIVFGAVFLITGLFLIFFLRRNRSNTKAVTDQTDTLTSSPTPNLMPFQEITIPYLRTRKYQSLLGELEKIEENTDYTTYISSYDSDGFRINGLLTIPKGQEPLEGWPAVIFIHGYIPPSQYQTTQNYTAYVDYLARNGLVVFKIDLRGHGDSEGSPSGAYYSGDYVVDTLNAYSALESTPFVNPKRIGLWGHSMAGNIVLRSFVIKKDIPAVVIWAGAVYTYEDMREFGINDNSYRPPSEDSEKRRYREKLRETYGDFDSESDFWQKVTPMSYLEGLTGAIQLHHATDDVVVDVNYSRNLMNLLDKISISHQLYEYSSGGHNITGSSFDEAMRETVAFFKEYL